MTAPQCAQPATTAGAPPVPVTLRAIAAWLESHPAAAVHFIDFGPIGGVTALGYLAGDDPQLDAHAARVGAGWVECRRGSLEWQIAPGVVYRLRDAR